MDATIVQQCKRGSFAGTLTFPENVSLLQQAGVERYYADLAQHRTIYYGVDGDALTEPWPLHEPFAVVDAFDAAGVKTALVASQQGQIQYPEFLRRIMAAGTASYTVFIQGRKVIYSGRHGDFYEEAFPGPK